MIKYAQITLYSFVILLIITVSFFNVHAQFDIGGQLVQRTEFRHGYGRLISENQDPAAFLSYRARLHFRYTSNRFTFYSSIQDVRTFGGSSISASGEPSLSFHEAWGEFKADTNWSVKVGRQELNYDNGRFLGGIDWAMKGKSHDFLLVKYESGDLKIDAGGAFNQDGERLEGNVYSTSFQYKTAQLLRTELKKRKFHISFLFWNNGMQFTVKDTSDKIIDKGVRFMQTIGLPTLKYTVGNTYLSGFYYHQLGKNSSGKKVNAFDASLQLSHYIHLNEERKKGVRLTAGTEILSGNTIHTPASESRAYSPLYGTNHTHNGYMDYFFVGGRHENSVGLIDSYLRITYDLNKNLFLSFSGHVFNAHASIYNADKARLNSYLGTETDFAAGWIIADGLSVQGGYSQFFSSASLEFIQKVTSPAKFQGWAYLMLIYRPKMNRPFIGLSF